MKHDAEELVITAAGAVTAAAASAEAHWQLVQGGTLRADPEAYSMKDFKPAPHLKDKRMLKAVSPADAIGLAALEGLATARALVPGAYAPERVGLYVGAPPASTFDNEPYMEALAAARGPNESLSVRAFGAAAMNARPTTLLVGLPNNVLCYGAMILDARGPNSNYTASGLSGHMALLNAAKRVRRGTLDLGVAGAFAAHTEPVNWRIYNRLGLVRRGGAVAPFAAGADGDGGTVVADGGVFLAVERRADALRRGGKPLATYLGGALASDGLGPLAMDERAAGLESAIRRALAEANVGIDDVGLVLATGSGVPRIDRAELAALGRVCAGARARPALGATTRIFGNLMEAGGLLELALLPHLAAVGELPASLRVDVAGYGHRWEPARPCALILRATPWGESSAIVARQEVQ